VDSEADGRRDKVSSAGVLTHFKDDLAHRTKVIRDGIRASNLRTQQKCAWTAATSAHPSRRFYLPARAG
jgi:hypothetical protein